MISPEKVKEKLLRTITDSRVRVRDLTGTGDHFRVEISSPDFEGKSLPDQHRMVYSALGDLMQNAIHALSIKTYTPSAWDEAVEEAGGPAISGVHIASPSDQEDDDA